MAKKFNSFCRNYVGVACVDGTCPMALREEYEERCIPLISDCKECHLYMGCEDCALYDTEHCTQEERGKYNVQEK